MLLWPSNISRNLRVFEQSIRGHNVLFAVYVLNRIGNNLFFSEDLVVFDRRKTISELIYCEVLVNLRTVKRSLMMITVTRRAVSVLRRKRKRSVVSTYAKLPPIYNRSSRPLHLSGNDLVMV